MSDFDRNSEEFQESVNMTPESDNGNNDESSHDFIMSHKDGSEGAHFGTDTDLPGDLSRSVKEILAEQNKEILQDKGIEPEVGLDDKDASLAESEESVVRHFSEKSRSLMEDEADIADSSIIQDSSLADDESADYHQANEYSEYRYSTSDAADGLHASDKQPMSFQGQHGQTFVLGMDSTELQSHQGGSSSGTSYAGRRQQAAGGSADASPGAAGNGGAGIPPIGSDNGGSGFYDNDQNINKKPGMGKRFVTLVASALVFGLIAGGVIWGVNKLGSAAGNDTTLETTAPQTAPQIAETEPPSDESNIIPTEAGSNAVSEIDSIVTQDVSDMVESVMPAMVSITNTYLYQNYNIYGSPMEVEGAGSGIIIGENETELLVLTNNHVVEDTTSLTVSFIDGATADAVIKGRDSEADLAVISIQLEDLDSETRSAIKAASLGNSDEMKLGQSVVAIGNALGYGQSVTVGVVSAMDREIEVDGKLMTLMQTDAAINFGNSGGALLNTRGEVIGVNVAKSTYNSAEGMGYAIPISSAEEIIDNLMTQETRIPVTGDNAAYLGISGDAIDSTMAKEAGISSGIFIYSVVEGSPAQEAGLQEKDILVSFDGKDVASMDELKEIIQYYESGTEVIMEVQRQEGGSYSKTSITVTLGSKPAQ